MDDKLLVLQLAAWMEKHLTDPEATLDLAKVSGYSENRLRQKFYNVTGETPSAYLRRRRLTEAARALIAGERIVDVAASYGYSSQDNFTTAFKAWFGIPPGELRTIHSTYNDLAKRMKEPLNVMMELANLKQDPLNTTLIGSLKGASEFFDLDWTTAKLFGYSTHAFAINIHRELCPSSPYCWNKDRLFLALRNMGIRRTGTIQLKRGAPPETVSEAEARIKAHLDRGKLCILDSLEHQLIGGYDLQGFTLLLPWKNAPEVTKPTLSFGARNEALEQQGWVEFTLLEKDEMQADEDDLLQFALQTALRMRSSPEEFRWPEYRFGDDAWEIWLTGIDQGLGSSHGHWWSATVWRECRAMAASFFEEVEPAMKSEKAAALCKELATLYRECSAKLGIARDKSTPASAQRAALVEGRELDQRCAGLMKELMAEYIA
jgi:AraC-like DNA-binding protein